MPIRGSYLSQRDPREIPEIPDHRAQPAIREPQDLREQMGPWVLEELLGQLVLLVQQARRDHKEFPDLSVHLV
jgi:hypothetical protein